ncbi:MAG: RsmD family RNA methyltransferase [Nitrososphaeraceae archaeon]|nr:RsmD family RNA methyltransferase [Nitrososphaeraceae archaeon]MDW0174714.1 RsmD family RNA methyltransferase [Nitrososphaeraceae archaeon]MDW0179704.1 RsmD family RNA methyltransferase [Nitrososphaeraceae archaeon]MDW0183122.1 RsmD family RNA methyltransferase [Nitrososphaeraceae archaeon]MDW0184021.1 RsmD family RNA methyltransferase [Nitrososphaeraceae archaeon]
MKSKSRLKNLENTVAKVLEDIEKTAKNEFLPSIGPIKGKIMKDIIKEHKPEKALEIGTLHGYSAILITINILIQKAEKKKMNIDFGNNSSEPIIITLEKDREMAQIARSNIEISGLSDKIHLINGDALKDIPKLKSKYKFDMVFLDATKSEYLKYLQLIEQYGLLNKRAVVVADNVIMYEDEMKDYLDYVRNSSNYISRTTKTTLEFNKKIKDALEVSINVAI